MNETLGVYIFYYFIVSSGLRVLIVLLSINQTPKSLGEKRVRFTVNAGSLLDVIHITIALLFLFTNHNYTVIHNFLLTGTELLVGWNSISLLFFAFCIGIMCLIGRFAIYYLHHDPHYFKFFILFYILQLALILLVTTRSSESIFIGWELLGISSVLLIAFYEHNKATLRNSLRVLAIYKIADIIFYSALIYAAVLGHTDYSHLTTAGVIFSITLACLIKSSVFPAIWLPNAMEGPTPSSAVFYGGLATHVPIFICINLSIDGSIDHLSQLQLAILLIITTLSVIYSSLLSRQCCNVKNTIAYSSVTQIGIIYLEIFLGFFYFALFHCIAHATVRMFELLRSPSQLYTRHAILQNKKSPPKTHTFLNELPLFSHCKNYLYRVTFNEWRIFSLLMTFVDNFTGVSLKRVTTRNLFTFSLCVAFIFFLLEVFIEYGLKFKIENSDYIFIVLALFSSVLALYNKFIPWLFFTSILLSVVITFDLLLEKLIPDIKYLDGFYVILLVYLVVVSIRQHHLHFDTVKFHRRIEYSDTISFIILILGFSLVGIPGLMTFFLWEHLQHMVLFLAPGLIINGFVLLSINTIVFFRFYYGNYLGAERTLAKVTATLRD